jgi:hypothetical protein
MTSTSAPEPTPAWWPTTGGRVPVEELARRQGVRPITSVDELVEPEAFESDEELDEFLADLYESRRSGLA